MTAGELIAYLSKMPRGAEVFVAVNAETSDEWFQRVDRIRLAPKIVLICDEDTQIV